MMPQHEHLIRAHKLEQPTVGMAVPVDLIQRMLAVRENRQGAPRDQHEKKNRVVAAYPEVQPAHLPLPPSPLRRITNSHPAMMTMIRFTCCRPSQSWVTEPTTEVVVHTPRTTTSAAVVTQGGRTSIAPSPQIRVRR